MNIYVSNGGKGSQECNWFPEEFSYLLSSFPQHYFRAVRHVAHALLSVVYVRSYIRANRAGCIGLLEAFPQKHVVGWSFLDSTSEAPKKVEGSTTPVVNRVQPLPLRYPAELKPVCAPAVSSWGFTL